MVGENDPRAHPTYTHKYAYRGLIPVEKASAVLGEDNACNSKMWLGKDSHVLTFPVNHGKTMNVVAFHTNPDEWPSADKLTLPSEKHQVKADFRDFGSTVQHIIDLLEPNLDCWAIFDLGDHPMEYYNKGRVCLLGDAAHATSPHHGSGAGFCIEDAAVMCELLADERVHAAGRKGIESAFKAFSDSRIERCNWLIQSSRRSGDLYEWRADGAGDDVQKIETECRERDEKIWNAQIMDMIEQGKQALVQALALA
jgi:salicylate hydroxylase